MKIALLPANDGTSINGAADQAIPAGCRRQVQTDHSLWLSRK